ncbi:MAG: IS110 family transposase [Thermoflexales bacterium]
MPAAKQPKSKAPCARKTRSPRGLRVIHPDAAGIDIGATSHYVAVPPDRAAEPVRCLGTHTADLHALVAWLKECQVTSVALESTGSYWIALYQVLERAGFQVLLCNARHVKNLPGRKTDVADAQWLQELHTHGLLSGSFRPADAVGVLRAYLRHRDNLTKAAGAHIQHRQKALIEMNLKLHHVLSDLTGVSGMAIIRAILAGERDPLKLAALKHERVKTSDAEIARALEGEYREEHLFAWRQAVELYDFFLARITACDTRIEAELRGWETKADVVAAPLPGPAQRRTAFAQGPHELRSQLYAVAGVDLTTLPGMEVFSVQALLSEIGTDMTRWKTEKHFCSWLRLCPDNRITGGKRQRGKPHKGHNRAAQILRVCAQAAIQSKSALGAFGRRLRARMDAPRAIKALAHKLARLLYRMLHDGTAYQDTGEHYYEERYRTHLISRLTKQAAHFGFHLTPATE